MIAAAGITAAAASTSGIRMSWRAFLPIDRTIELTSLLEHDHRELQAAIVSIENAYRVRRSVA